MTRAAASAVRGPRAAMVLLALLAAACSQTPCAELEAAPIAGSYKGGGTLGGERMLRVGVEANAQQVVLTYTAMDGSRIRAKYRVAKKLKKPLTTPR